MSTSVYFDLETGGLEDRHPNIQLAAIAVNESTWQELATLECKIRFNEADADPEALKINHYEPAIWEASAISPAEAVRKFGDLLNRFKSLQMTSRRTGKPYSVARLVGHNAATFDGPRIRNMFRQHDAFLPADPRVRCTCQAAMWWFDSRGIEPPSYKLASLCEYFGLPVAEDAHDALADVRMTIQLARQLRSEQSGTVAA